MISCSTKVEKETKEHGWEKLTPALLQEIESAGGKFWIALKGCPNAYVGEYEWRQGRNPHGFNDDNGWRMSAHEVTHVMVYNPPIPPVE